jgi:hypothetical protein
MFKDQVILGRKQYRKEITKVVNMENTFVEVWCADEKEMTQKQKMGRG